MHSVQQVLILVGRMLLSAIFIMSGIHKLTAWDTTLEQMQAEGIIENTAPLLAAAAAAELLGGLSILLGVLGRIGALGLFAFLIPTTFIFHDFWTYEGQAQQMEMIQFVKNLAIMGGLLIVAAFGTGSWSLTGRKTGMS